MWTWKLKYNLGENTAFGFQIVLVPGGLEGSQYVPRPRGLVIFIPKACTAVSPQQSRESQVVSWLLNNLMYACQVWATKSKLPTQSPSRSLYPNSTSHSALFLGLNSRLSNCLSFLNINMDEELQLPMVLLILHTYELHGAGGCVVPGWWEAEEEEADGEKGPCAVWPRASILLAGMQEDTSSVFFLEIG